MFLVLYQCLQALDFLHLRQVIQRDLKSSNILLEWMALSSWVGILGQAQCSWDVDVGLLPSDGQFPKSGAAGSAWTLLPAESSCNMQRSLERSRVSRVALLCVCAFQRGGS